MASSHLRQPITGRGAVTIQVGTTSSSSAVEAAAKASGVDTASTTSTQIAAVPATDADRHGNASAVSSHGVIITVGL